MSKFYFSRLSALHKTVYKSIVTGITEYKHEIPLMPMESDEFSVVFNAVLLDNPLIFHVNSYNYVVYSGGTKCGFKPIYECSKSDYENYVKEISKALSEFDFMRDETDFKKEIYVHDYCIKHLIYGDLFEKFSYSVLGAIVKKSAVCEGIAKFVKLVLDYLRVKCLVVKGEAINPFTMASEKHAWNIVKLGDLAYHLDVTFDLCLSEKISRYDYFNLSDEEIKRDHVFGSELPKCSAGNDYYFVHKQVVCNPREMKKYIVEKLEQGKRDFAFKITEAQNIENITERVLQIAASKYEEMFNEAVKINLNYNLKQGVFEIGFG